MKQLNKAADPMRLLPVPSRVLFVLVAISAFTGCTSQSPPSAMSPGTNNYDWPHYANDLRSSKYAGLEQISATNVSNLEVAWTWDSPDNAMVVAKPELTPISYKSTPIKIGNRLFINTSLGQIAALDASTGHGVPSVYAVFIECWQRLLV